MRRVATGLLVLGAISCGGSDEDTGLPIQPDSGSSPQPKTSPDSSGLPPLFSIDLSDDTVRDMPLSQLWTIGVELLRWPREMPADATKEEVHQRLLTIKFKDVGDFGYTGDAPKLGYD